MAEGGGGLPSSSSILSGIQTKIGAVEKDIKAYKDKLAEAERDEDKKEAKRLEGIIDTKEKRLTGLEQDAREARQSQEPSMHLEPFFQSSNDFPVLIYASSDDEECGFKSQCVFDSGSEFPLILPRRKIAQLGLKCLGRGCGVNSGTTDLFPYEAVVVKIPYLNKESALIVHGVSPQLVEKYRKENNIKPVPRNEKKKKKTLSTSCSSSAAASPSRRSPRMLTMKLSPCKRYERDEIDSDTLIGRPGLTELGLDMDFKRNQLKVVRERKRVRKF